MNSNYGENKQKIMPKNILVCNYSIITKEDGSN